MIKSKRRLTQHKRFMPYGTHPNFCFAKTSFMLEPLSEILLFYKILLESARQIGGINMNMKKKFFFSPLVLLIGSLILFGISSLSNGHTPITIILVLTASGLFLAALLRQYQMNRNRTYH
ncbi:MAG: hypothetical protein A3B15_01620 [Candidatus Buchananbacteria bacterium RIFCSPLOWO2_01_FULL_45_31]|uniref:Uncharacterized protein n=3 Tax=Candidatus Buchananiibacteriota TaxID=1817903 RepID=A0A1G1YQB1_9BACT|nr:MAG: hypothetical protein A3B15_01620 [Candidatus Buchananbacteria bacterium RIFCSPLOWO2_01_FULL_45_31]